MPKSPKKSPSPKPSTPRPNWVPLIIAGAAGFLGAFVLLKGCPFTMLSCPAYKKICPVTSTMDRLEGCLAAGNLASANSCGAKLVELFDPSMPELAKAAEPIADAKTLADARKAYDSLKAKIKTGQPMPASASP
jgi:hypothetical protein